MSDSDYLYLRLIDTNHRSAEEQRESIEAAFAHSEFELFRPPEAHGRGGWIVYVRCTKDHYQELIGMLENHGLLSVV